MLAAIQDLHLQILSNGPHVLFVSHVMQLKVG